MEYFIEKNLQKLQSVTICPRIWGKLNWPNYQATVSGINSDGPSAQFVFMML